MKRQITIIILTIFIASCAEQIDNSNSTKTTIMEKRYFSTDEFNSNFGKEMATSQDIYESMTKSGLKEYQFCTYDFDFLSDKKEKLDSLAYFLKQHYNYKINEIKKEGDGWILRGDALPFPVDSTTLLYWAVDMYVLGYNFDSKLSGYGALVDTATFPDLSKDKADFYFDEGLKAYNNKNRFGAIVNWTTVLKIDPKDVNAYYSRAIVKNELYLWKAALRDYDKAIEIAPKFTDALTNRATVKDESGDYDGAIADYNKVIELDNKNAMAFFNRGNSKFNKGDKTSACLDWKKAKELGAEYADERLTKECK